MGPSDDEMLNINPNGQRRKWASFFLPSREPRQAPDVELWFGVAVDVQAAEAFPNQSKRDELNA
jgi:hypothetical protein